MFAVANVVQHTRAGTEFNRGIVDLSINRKRGCAAADEPRYRKSVANKLIAECLHLSELSQDRFAAFVTRLLMLMPVVDMKTTGSQTEC